MENFGGYFIVVVDKNGYYGAESINPSISDIDIAVIIAKKVS